MGVVEMKEHLGDLFGSMELSASYRLRRDRPAAVAKRIIAKLEGSGMVVTSSCGGVALSFERKARLLLASPN